jgi:hypothetical protein
MRRRFHILGIVELFSCFWLQPKLENTSTLLLLKVRDDKK